MFFTRPLLRIDVCALFATCLILVVVGTDPAHAQNAGLHTDDGGLTSAFAEPKAVRNAQPIPGEEITILRSFKIKKGSYAEFHRRSVEGIWPFFEKIGARVIGMWQVDPTAIDSENDAENDAENEKNYDEAILLTRYASLGHWRASRSGIDLGGNGPDAEALVAAHTYRQSVTLETSFQVLRGSLARNGPYFMPAVEE
jgi:hypothetical protein